MAATVSILGCPFDEQSSFLRGCAEGPAAIRRAFLCDSTNTFCEAGFDILGHPMITDRGDLESDNGQFGEPERQLIERTIQSLSKSEGQKILCLGGDHAITWPILRGLNSRYSNLNVLHLDAHSDLYDELDGNPFSHATPMARALEQGLIKRLVQVGIRTMNTQQQTQADRFNVEVVPMSDWDSKMDYHFDGPVYLSLDLDVLDPAFAPGVSHHEPGGCSTRQLIELIQNLNEDLVGADIVELNPSRDLNATTGMVAAKLMKEILAKMLA